VVEHRVSGSVFSGRWEEIDLLHVQQIDALPAIVFAANFEEFA
jgi:hypothetical protein